jgi:hypothetical protein
MSTARLPTARRSGSCASSARPRASPSRARSTVSAASGAWTAALRFLGERHPDLAELGLRAGSGADTGTDTVSRRPARSGGKKAWFTDTLTDVNGVAKTVRTLAGLARRRGRCLVAITCGESNPPPDLEVRDFRPVAQFPIPGYESQTLALPPLLEVLEHCERERYSEILISTPGPLGLVGLAAGHLLGIPVTGIYHTDFPMYVRHLSGSATLEELTWTYMRWFFGSMERVFVASRCYLDLLAEHGLDRARMALLPRGGDATFFHPGSADARSRHAARAGSAGTGSDHAVRLASDAPSAPPLDAAELEMRSTIGAWHDRQS